MFLFFSGAADVSRTASRLISRGSNPRTSVATPSPVVLPTPPMKNVSDVGFATKQFFAVGHPAKNLAANDSVRATFEMKALEALSEGQYVRDEASQRIVAYLFPNGRRGADGKPLKPDADRMKQLQAWYEKQPGGENVKFIDFVYDAANADLRKGAVASFKLPPTGG